MKNKTAKPKIDIEKCKGCLLCVSVCPGKALALSGELNERGLRYVILKDTDKCTGCGMCALVCPDCAIEIKS